MKVLVAGVGNIFLGDDAFGVEVVKRLAGRTLPAEVKVVDFGIRGFDLAYALLEDFELVILVDAAQRGTPPGTLQVIEPTLADLDNLSADASSPETHGMVPGRAIEMARAMGARIKTLRVVCCEPASLEPAEDLGLTKPVAAALDEAVALVEALIEQFLNCSCTNLA